MEKNTKTLLGVALLGGAAFMLLNKEKPATDQSGSYDMSGGGSSIGGAGEPIFNLTPPSEGINPVQENEAPINNKKAIVIGSAEAASADINQQLNAYLGIGDATRSEGNKLIFNIPRSSGAALAAERYTAQNYPNSIYNEKGGNIVFLVAPETGDSKKQIMSAAPSSGGSSSGGFVSPAPAGTGLYSAAPVAKKQVYATPAPPKEAVGVSKVEAVGVSKVKAK